MEDATKYLIDRILDREIYLVYRRLNEVLVGGKFQNSGVVQAIKIVLLEYSMMAASSEATNSVKTF